jgi:hypothetical protein
MNGMCIPEEYFLDGEFDCLDWSDEIQYYDDANCPIEGASAQCDDRICPLNQYSCGDGQCILNRFEFQKLSQIKSECRSRREQYFKCETHYVRQMWTLPNGRCYDDVKYKESNVNNRTINEECQYLLQCALSREIENHCPCGHNSSCTQQLNVTCPSGSIRYPKGGVIIPYVLSLYYQTRKTSLIGPDFYWINGTITCDGVLTDIPGYRFSYISTFRQVEDAVCQYATNDSLFSNNNSYDRSCYHQSLTFNNRSYSFTNICNKSKECISTYRIKDGFVNCADEMDEIGNISISIVCSKMQRYRFRCSAVEPTCLSIVALGNLQTDCKNTFDELWLGTSTKLADINCNKLWKDQCEILRQYIKNSWIWNDMNSITKQLRIPFRHYCDTFWNLASREDESLIECKNWWICTEEQWQCDSGQCIEEKWVLDGEWDCFDASDEDDPFNRLIMDRNLQVLPLPTLINRSIKLNKSTPFITICNLTTEFPCFSVSFSNPLDNLTKNRPCISRHRIGDGRIDCYGAIDERNTITHCNQPSMLGYNFQCKSSRQCIPYWNHCLGDRCRNITDDWFWCDRRQNLPSCNSFSDSVCFNGTCVRDGRCNRISDCPFGEDEYMCEYQTFAKLTGVLYRKDKESTAKNTEQKLRLIQFPTDSNITVPTIDSTSTTATTLTVTISPNNTVPIAFWCNRGIGVRLFNGSFACFCSLQYYGDKCQFHTDRITILLHLNLSQSIYTINTDINIVLKMVVLLFFKNETITNHIFHVRPVSDLFINAKKIIHFPYSRSSRFLQHKAQRYFNQSNIVNDHPYSVRIEAYERKDSGEPVLIAVWQYPIYFDYLPVFRFAKVLRLTKPNMQQNPCSSNPCNQNQDCQQLINDKFNYICLCKSNFTGENCLIEDRYCTEGYCLSGSICKPNYRGLLTGNAVPYCICPFDYYGERCDIKHDRCLITPCQNNGSCFSTSIPNTVGCMCTEQYYGKNCELRKPAVKLYINKSVNHIAAVVQYFDIDLISLNLILVHQQVYRTLPALLEYRHGQKTAPEIILVKLYSSQTELSVELYLISVHINVATIYATTQVIENTRCVDIRTLILDNETQVISNYSPIKYHYLCRNNTNLFCFRDGFYLCICDENHSRVECFLYDSTLDQCSQCLAGGRCLTGDRLRPNNFICLCPPCHSGTNCQFNSNSFAFTLDQLFFTDLISINQKPTVRLLIIISVLLFLLAIPNNLFSIVTFRRRNCLCNGIGQYLLYMSVINQLNLGLLASRLIHLAINITGLHSHPLINHYLCKILSYLLTSSSRMVYWLSSLVAIERVYMTLFLNGRWLRKPYIARRLIVFTVISILISDIHELIFVKSLFGINDGKGGMCVIEFPINYRSTWLLFHLILSIMNSILPLLINICCTITISCIVLKKKMNTRKTIIVLEAKTTTHESRLVNFRTHLHFVFEVLSENKELVIGPSITLVPQLFSLPLFVISFTLYCQNLESSWMRYLLIASYFTSFIPQLISFMLYILPSSFYLTEWRGTKIGRRISSFFQWSRSDLSTSDTM